MILAPPHFLGLFLINPSIFTKFHEGLFSFNHLVVIYKEKF
jgi:hypothetical protein